MFWLASFTFDTTDFSIFCLHFFLITFVLQQKVSTSWNRVNKTNQNILKYVYRNSYSCNFILSKVVDDPLNEIVNHTSSPSWTLQITFPFAGLIVSNVFPLTESHHSLSINNYDIKLTKQKTIKIQYKSAHFNTIPAGKIAEKEMWRSVFLTIWHRILNADSLLQFYFLAILPAGTPSSCTSYTSRHNTLKRRCTDLIATSKR